MLDRDIVLKSGIHGIAKPPESINNTSRWYSAKEKKWIINHPSKKQLSIKKKERSRNRMKIIRNVPSSVHFPEATSTKKRNKVNLLWIALYFQYAEVNILR